MKVVLLGPPGSGKGTVAQMLVEDFDFEYLSTGIMFREEAKKQDEMGKKIKELIDNGNYVPDDVTIPIVQNIITPKDHYILDGFPRTAAQVEAIEAENVDLVLYLHIDESVSVERLSERRTDPVTGRSYHLVKSPPPKEIIDRLIQRDDDRPEIIRRRCSVYNEKTKKVVDMYREDGVLVEVDANPSPDEVYVNVKKIIEAKL